MKYDPYISVIIPAHNGGAHLDQCLDALLSDGREFEIILIDDASTDESVKVARTHAVRVIEFESRCGPAAARNRGAREARGKILLFIDADVVVRPDTVARVAAHFRTRTRLAALFGSYDDAPAAANFVSQYKNLFHHFVHQQGREMAETFWAGCGAIRREIFLRLGGFDEKRYTEPSIEDIELGYRLRREGYNILLDKGLQVRHLKRWTLMSLLQADIFRRAMPWSKLILERKHTINDLNLRVEQRLSAMATFAALALLPFCFAFPILLAPASLLFASVCLLNRKMYAFFLRRHGFVFLTGAVMLHLLYYCYSSGIFALCCISHVFRRKKDMAHAGEMEATG